MKCHVLAALVVGAVAGPPPAVPAAEPARPLEFLRVHVAPGRLADSLPGAERHVPMPLSEFDAAVTGHADGREARGPVAAADEARYDMRVDAQGRLAGTVQLDLGPAAAALCRWIPLGDIDARDATVEAVGGVGEAALFGTDAGVALHTPAAGTYTCGLTCPPEPTGLVRWRLPLAPALVTTVRLLLPAGSRPDVIGGSAARSARRPAAERRGIDEWTVSIGPGVERAVVVTVGRPTAPQVAVWNAVRIRAGHAAVSTTVEPATAWSAEPFSLECAPELRLTFVGAAAPVGPTARLEAVWSPAAAGVVAITPPPELVGTLRPLTVEAVAPAAIGTAWPLPTVRPPADRWAGGGLVVNVDPAFAVAEVSLAGCLAVEPQVGRRWPVDTSADHPHAAAVKSATMYFEQQTAGGNATVMVQRRTPILDVARVTTIELLPASLVGRAACDIQVVVGEAFEITGRVAPGWIIDAVDAVDWSDEPREASAPAAERTIDWRVVSTPEGSELRVGLAIGATPDRGLGLRIRGHRPGGAVGIACSTADMDMIRLEGETAGAALLDFRVGQEAVVEIGGGSPGIAAATGRLAALVEAGSSRGRCAAHAIGPAAAMRIVRRRPPLAATVQIHVVARGEQLAESFTFRCQPSAGDVESVVIHFSEPLGESVEWSPLQPEGSGLAARRLEPGDGVVPEAGRIPAFAESWLVEVQPAVAGSVSFRASRTLPFAAAVPVPLAWVEGATEPLGSVFVRSAGGHRPAVFNRRLRELPPESGDAEDAAAVVAEFAYGDPQRAVPAAEVAPPLEVAPGHGSDPRAWVWREATTCWCHDSGLTEVETMFEIENHGRDSLALDVPVGIRVDRVAIDGVDLPPDPWAAGGGSRLPLPAGRSRVSVLVHGVAEAPAGIGFWRTGPLGSSLDVPVLDRVVRCMLPPDLELVFPTVADGVPTGWAQRLFGIAALDHAEVSMTIPTGVGQFRGAGWVRRGFRELPLSTAARGLQVGLGVMRRRLLTAAALLVALMAAVGTAVLGRRRSGWAVAVGLAAVLAALWLPQPGAEIARAAWWGALAGLAAAFARRAVPRSAGTALVMAAVCGGPLAIARAAETRAAEPEPLRVYVLPGADGGTALVPESLFRELAAERATASAAVRVTRCTLLAQPDAATWRLAIDLESDGSGLLVLRQPADGSRWRPTTTAGEGLRLDTQSDGRVARVVVPAAGRHHCELELEPVFERHGDVETTVVGLPPAAVSIVRTPAGWQCDRADLDGPWLQTPWRVDPGRGATHDVARAARVRLTRPVDPRDEVVATIREAVSGNDVAWRSDRCTVKAVYDFGSVRGIVRSVVMRVGGGLEPVAARIGPVSLPAPRPLGAGRYLVDIPEPERGRVRLDVEFARKLVTPVGVFDLPGAWLERVGSDSRTVRIATDPDFELQPDLPPGVAQMRPRPGDEPDVVAAWQAEAVDREAVGNAATDAAAGGDQPQPVRLSVRRRQPPLRVIQDLQVEVAAEQTDLAFACQIDASGAPLVELSVAVPPTAAVDRVEIVSETIPAAVDAFWSRPAADRLRIVVQRPRTGRFRLVVRATIPTPPEPEGRLPLVRVAPPLGAALVVRWRALPPFDVSVEGADAPAGTAPSREVAAGEAGPAYALSIRPPVVADAVAPTDAPAAQAVSGAGDACEARTINLVLDDRGRGWGVVRFDVVTSAPQVRLRLPAGMRLYSVLVDGRETPAVAREGDAWDVPLHDVGWPRSVLAAFAGELGGRPVDGAPLLLDAPGLEGLPGGETQWTISAPRGLELRVAPPARQLDDREWAAAVAAARDRVEARFDAMLADVGTVERERLRGLLGARGSGRPPALEAEWGRSVAGAEGATRIHVATAGDEGVTLRATRRVPPLAESRGLASIVLLGAAFLVSRLLAGSRTADGGSAPPERP